MFIYVYIYIYIYKKLIIIRISIGTLAPPPKQNLKLRPWWIVAIC